MLRDLRILIVEDEWTIAETLSFALRGEGFSTHHVSFAHVALEEIAKGGVDFAILDVGLPDMSGFELCKRIRQISPLPVLFLTARGDEIDRVVGLEIGGDDYVTKPFSPREVVARVKAIAKRAGGGGGGRGGPSVTGEAASDATSDRWFSVDEARARIRFMDQWLELTRSEFMILQGMLRAPERVHARAQIQAFVSDEPNASLERTVDVHVKALRAKLRRVDPGVDPIETHRGFGYSVKNPRRTG